MLQKKKAITKQKQLIPHSEEYYYSYICCLDYSYTKLCTKRVYCTQQYLKK